MKCYKCNGTGYYDIDNKCPVCDGTGEYEPFDTDVELDKLYPTKQTNEEWFCQLPTYKKAIIMANCYDALNLDQYACNKHIVIEKWLKNIHE